MSKKILFLAHENEVDHSIAIAAKLEKMGHHIDFFVCDFFSYFSKNYVYEQIKSQNFKINNIFNINNELKEILDIKKNQDIKVNWEYLRNFEKKLENPFIVKNIYNDFTFNEIYSPRDYYSLPENKNISFKLIELLCKKIESINIENYDLIYSTSTTNFCRNIIADLAENKKIPILSIIERFYQTAYIQDTYFKKMPKYFKFFFDNFEKSNIFLHNFTREKPVINPKHQFIFKNLIQNLLVIIKDNFRVDYLIKEHFRLKNISKNGYFFIKSFFFVKYTTIRENVRNYRIYKLCNKDIKNKIKDLPNYKYIYFPLHLTPESGVMNHKKFMDELFYIQILSKILPVDYKIVVKPNPYSFKNYMNQYPYERYLKISKIPNVVMVGPDVEANFLIKNSKAVITISGSSSIEALFFKKPGFIFANTEFDSVKGIFIFDEKTFMKIIDEWTPKLFNQESLHNYINNILFYGLDEISENIIYPSAAIKKDSKKVDLINDKIVKLINDNYLR